MALDKSKNRLLLLQKKKKTQHLIPAAMTASNFTRYGRFVITRDNFIHILNLLLKMGFSFNSTPKGVRDDRAFLSFNAFNKALSQTKVCFL